MADSNVIARALAEARRRKATPKEILALKEAALVESGGRHLTGGDRDSTGFLQQRPSQGWGPVGESVEKDTAQFLDAARKYRGQGGSAGQLAQKVQRSAFPDRYDQVKKQALALGGGGSDVSAPTPEATSSLMAPDPEAQKRVALAGLLQQSDPDSLLLKLGIVDPNEPTQRTESDPSKTEDPISKTPDGTSSGEFGVNELFWDKNAKYNLDQGKQTSPIGGHGDHVHVAVNDKSQIPALKQLAKSMGLHAGGDTDKSGHTAGSFHYSGKAIDVSGDPVAMEKYAQAVYRRAKRR